MTHGGFIGALFTDEQARGLFTDGQHVEYIDVAGDGVSQTELQQRVEQVSSRSQGADRRPGS